MQTQDLNDEYAMLSENDMLLQEEERQYQIKKFNKRN
jgi:hypothetical protein